VAPVALFDTAQVRVALCGAGPYLDGHEGPTSDKEHDAHRPPRAARRQRARQHLGVNIRHIRRLVAERRIPFIKWGHLLRFDPDEIVDWLEYNRRRIERER
jgi:excisionase family DNA binding protein